MKLQQAIYNVMRMGKVEAEEDDGGDDDDSYILALLLALSIKSLPQGKSRVKCL